MPCKKISSIRNVFCGVSVLGKTSIKQYFYFVYGSICYLFAFVNTKIVDSHIILDQVLYDPFFQFL